MNPAEPATERIQAINAGLRAFIRGIPGVVPFLGIPFALGAILNWKRAKRIAWNPAEDYARTGAFLGLLGLLLSALMLSAALIIIGW